MCPVRNVTYVSGRSNSNSTILAGNSGLLNARSSQEVPATVALKAAIFCGE
jgi:hypothetical protein